MHAAALARVYVMCYVLMIDSYLLSILSAITIIVHLFYANIQLQGRVDSMICLHAAFAVCMVQAEFGEAWGRG